MTKGTRKLGGVIDIFSILTLVKVSQVYTYDSFIKLDILNVCTLLYVHDALLYFKQSKANRGPNIEGHRSLVPIVSW